MRSEKVALIDAGVFIGALLRDDPRHFEARPIVEDARFWRIRAYTTSGILSEVYAALTWEKAKPQHGVDEAAQACQLSAKFLQHLHVRTP